MAMKASITEYTIARDLRNYIDTCDGQALADLYCHVFGNITSAIWDENQVVIEYQEP